MLWQQGQARLGRESKERLSEIYLAVRDGYVTAQVDLKKATAHGSTVPSYARPDAEEEARLGSRGLAQLMADFPGQTERGREFSN